MTTFVARRLAIGILQILFVTTIAWLLFYVIARTSGASPAERVAGKNASPQVIARVARSLGTDRPYIVQYFQYLGHLLHGNFGYSYYQHRSVLSILLPAAGTTASLVVVAVVLWLAVAIPVGLFAALRAGRFADYALRTFVVLGISVPIFLVAPLMSYLFAYQPAIGKLFGISLGRRVQLFPLDGYVGVTQNPIEWLYHLILPAAVIAVGASALYVRYIRALTLEHLGYDYVRTAIAKGVGRRRLIGRHVSRNIAPVIVTLIGLDVAAALGGVLFVENVFALPGLGFVTLESIQNLDYAVASGAITFTAIVAVAINALIDVAQGILDPRVRA